MRFFNGVFRDIRDERVVDAIESIPREKFVPARLKYYAYANNALPIGHGQTISQPSLVAYMTQLLKLTEDKKVLEIGTGSGYQTALLAKLAYKVYTVEIIEELQEKAKKILNQLKIYNVEYKLGDGCKGYEKYAPYDGILATAAFSEVPAELLKQLKDKGRMVIPVGNPNSIQTLKLIIKDGNDFIEKDLKYVRFVPAAERKLD